MTKEEFINLLTTRTLNNKNNNMIIVTENPKDLVHSIPNTCAVSFNDNDIDDKISLNIKIDLSQINVHDILTYVLNYLKELKIIDVFFDYTLSFENKFDILKFQSILKNYDKIVQIIFYNLEEVNKEEQMLINELYYFNSLYFNVISLINDNFKTYFLSQNRVLDDRENYHKYKIAKEKSLRLKK